MICGIEIALAIYGLIALFTGKLTFSQGRAVHGVAARLLGLVALTPFPIAFSVGFVIGLQAVAENRAITPAEAGPLVFVEAGVTILVALIVFGLGYALSETKDPEEKVARRRDRDDDDDLDIRK